ncbi:MAG: hypothetical protein V4506_02880, partial [Bacteroidota bacterium]
MKFLKYIFALYFLTTATTILAQEEPKKDEKKIQEVVNVEPETQPAKKDAEGNEIVDTLPPPPASISEILKRAVNFVKIESSKYTKANGVTTGAKAEFVASFPYKPKELNPLADVQGNFTMHVSVEAKDGKYRYTISKITHVAKNPEFTGGDVYQEVPKCGSMKLPTDLWKRLRSESLKNATQVATDLKAFM